MISMNFIEIFAEHNHSDKTPYVVIGVAAVAAEVGVGFIVEHRHSSYYDLDPLALARLAFVPGVNSEERTDNLPSSP